MIRARWRLALVLLGVAFAAPGPLLAQNKGKDDDEVAKTPVDPFTGGDAALLTAGGHVSYGPFVWSKETRTEDIDRVLGEGRVLWLETAHFRIGCNVRTVPLPEKQGQRKAVLDEVAALKKRFPKIPEKPKRLEPWLRLHLFALRAEKLYAEVESMLTKGGATFGDATTPPNGRYLGLPDKHLLLVFQKKSDLARYFDRFCGVTADRSFGYYLPSSHQMLYGVSVEGLEAADDPALHSHVLYGLAGNLANGLRGYEYRMAPWLCEGLAHCLSRRVDTDFVNITVKDEDNVNQEEQHLWAKKVRARAQYDRTRVPFATMAGWAEVTAMGYHGELQAWSRVHFLLEKSPEKVGTLMWKLKSLSVPPGGLAQEELQKIQFSALQEVFGLDAATFDAEWRDWVLATYPKK